MTVRRMWRLTAAVLAAVFLWALFTQPPSPAPTSGNVDEGLRQRTVAGAIHVHSTRSDGTGDREAIAAAAARAGLRFVVVTDHGDATRVPDPPAYLHRVLCLDAVEISTNDGHYVALGLPAAPYPLGGDAAAVVEDVHRLGGFGIAAHPDSPKPDLQWREWAAPLDGLEWLNLDSEWRDEPRARLARVTFDYLFRPGPALAAMLDRPSATLDRWDAMLRTRSVVALAGHDAHGGWAARAEDGRQRTGPRVLPSYEASFRAFAVRAMLDTPFSGDAAADAGQLLRSLQMGRAFTAIDALAGPAWIDFTATAGASRATMGETVPFADGAALTVRTSVAPASRVVLIRDGAVVAESASGELRAPATAAGAYRVEVRIPGAPGTPPVPWLVSNPISLRDPRSAGASSVASPATSVLALAGPVILEKDPASSGQVTSPVTGPLALDYQLAGGERVSQYVAMALPMPDAPPAFTALTFTARSREPMRVSVQLRFNSDRGHRWARSVFVSPEGGRIEIPVSSLRSVDLPSQPLPPGSPSSLLFVIDLVNARPGSSGHLEISDISLASIATNR